MLIIKVQRELGKKGREGEGTKSIKVRYVDYERGGKERGRRRCSIYSNIYNDKIMFLLYLRIKEILVNQQ